MQELPKTTTCVTVGDLREAIKDVPDDTLFYIDADLVNDVLGVTYSDGYLYIEAAAAEGY